MARIQALELLGKPLGMFSPRQNQGEGNRAETEGGETQTS